MKYAVVTGSTKGIGRAIAEKLLAHGYHVIVNYAADDESAQRFLAQNSACAQHITCIKADLSDYDEADQFAQKALAVTQEVTALVLNCGATDRSAFSEIKKETWEKVLRVNVSIPRYLIQKFEGSLCDEAGRILFIGSVCGQFPHAKSLAYGVSKAAVHQMARELVKVFASRGITCNAIVPGFVETPWQDGKTPELRERICQKIALHRFAHAEEIAELCWCVINDQYINGAVLNIDGGYCCL